MAEGDESGEAPSGPGDDTDRPDIVVHTLVVLDDVLSGRVALGNIPASIERLGCSLSTGIVFQFHGPDHPAVTIEQTFKPRPAPHAPLLTGEEVKQFDQPRRFDIDLMLGRIEPDGPLRPRPLGHVLFRCRAFFVDELYPIFRPGPADMDPIFEDIERGEGFGGIASDALRDVPALSLVYAITDFEPGSGAEGGSQYGADRLVNAAAITAAAKTRPLAVALGVTGYERLFAEFSPDQPRWRRFPSAFGAALDDGFVRSLLLNTLRQREHLVHEMRVCAGSGCPVTVTMVAPFGFLKGPACANWDVATDEPRVMPAGKGANNGIIVGEHDAPQVIPIECATPLISAVLGQATPFQLVSDDLHDLPGPHSAALR